jgi:hypothetical protein
MDMRKETLALVMTFAFSWVLWGNEFSRFVASDWKIISGHASLKACRSTVPTQVTKLLKLDGTARRDSDKVFFSKPTDQYYGQTTLRLVCLPGTVDPRGAR